MTATLDQTPAAAPAPASSASMIEVELGNAAPVLTSGSNPGGEVRDAPCVTYVHIPNDPENFPEGHHAYQQVQDSGITGRAIYDHIAEALMSADGRVTRLPGHEPVLVVVSPFGAWRAHAKSGTKPTWVWSNDAEVQRLVAEYFECPQGRPDDVEATHYTSHERITYAPGEAPVQGVPTGSLPDVQANITQNGRDMQARVFGLGSGVGGTNTTAPTSSSLTLDDQSAPGSTSKWNGQPVYIGGVWANIVSNTNASPPVLTLDRYYTPATPGGSAAGTPAAGKYVVAQCSAAVQFMGLSASTTTLGTPSTNTSLPGEITTSGGGLIRQICPVAHTASAATTTLTPVYTANGSDSLPVTLGSVGTFNSMVVADTTQTMFFNTLFSATATLSSPGDQLTVTQTITGT